MVTVTWTSAVSTIVDGVIDPTTAGMQDVYVSLDGNIQYPVGCPPQSSGTFVFSADAGNHVLSFDDSSNIRGDLHNRTGNINVQLTFAIAPAPKPVSIAFLGLGGFGLLSRRRAHR